MAIQPIFILQKFDGQIDSYSGYFKVGRKVQPPMTCSSSSLSGTDLFILAFHLRDKFLNLTRGLKKALIEAVTRLNNEKMDFPKVRVKYNGEGYNLE